MTTSVGFLSTYPPTQCGLATFTDALRVEMADAGHPTGVVRVLDAPAPAPATGGAVVATMVHGAPDAERRAAHALDAFDVVVVQHEFGIYAGADGESVVEVLARLSAPSIVVLHTVLVSPSDHQRLVLEEVVRLADRIVTMTTTARQRLVDLYDVDADKIVVIPHGAPDALPVAPRDPARRPLILTWGLLGPGKGIERVIDALVDLRHLDPLYLVVGDTHPRVLDREGERYRDSLLARARQLGVADLVAFRSGYLELGELRSLAAAADVVVLPYDSREQVTSGVLIEAVAAGRPVVATAFAHAVELLCDGAGIVVDHDDPPGMAGAIARVLSDPSLASSMARRSAELSADLVWSAVAGRYLDMAGTLHADDAIAVA